MPPDPELPETPELSEITKRHLMVGIQANQKFTSSGKQKWKDSILNNLDYFSDSELNSESDEGEQYKYEHGYETLI